MRGSEIKPHFIYGSCREHGVQLRYVGDNKWNRAIAQCPICFEKRIVPREWVVGLKPCGLLGFTKEERAEANSKAKLKKLMDSKGRRRDI